MWQRNLPIAPQSEVCRRISSAYDAQHVDDGKIGGRDRRDLRARTADVNA
ncbi:MAG: hypothetical protein ACLRSD_16255 [Oscillibacter sp.]